MTNELYYWPTLQGRGEFVRLALEDAGAPYIDVARGGPGDEADLPALAAFLDDPSLVRPPFALPALRDGDLVVAQTAAILLYLGPRLGLAGPSKADRIWAHQLQLTIAYMVTEAHDTHHPVAAILTYEEQKPEAARRAADFRTERIPKFFGWFERVLERNDGRHLVGRAVSYADLSLFQLVAGLLYAFPKATEAALKKHPCLEALHRAVPERPRLSAYLTSQRRIPFNEQGIFRRYPELDA
ncbi:glutathione S-transferase [Methylobacterium oxalidis]|uniref:glutathione S-transferase n=1 Tax=Methylobacterium oxalidis TaxID=944322 RepID=UPI003315D5D0